MIKTKENSEHYFWGNRCESWVLNNDDQIVVKQELMPSGSSEQEHYHTLVQQFFFILKGEATFHLNGEVLTLDEQQGISVSPKVKHKICNNSETELEFLVISNGKPENNRVLV